MQLSIESWSSKTHENTVQYKLYANWKELEIVFEIALLTTAYKGYMKNLSSNRLHNVSLEITKDLNHIEWTKSHLNLKVRSQQQKASFHSCKIFGIKIIMHNLLNK